MTVTDREAKCNIGLLWSRATLLRRGSVALVVTGEATDSLGGDWLYYVWRQGAPTRERTLIGAGAQFGSYREGNIGHLWIRATFHPLVEEGNVALVVTGEVNSLSCDALKVYDGHAALGDTGVRCSCEIAFAALQLSPVPIGVTAIAYCSQHQTQWTVWVCRCRTLSSGF